MNFDIIQPSTGERIDRLEPHGESEQESCLQSCVQVQRAWSRLALTERLQLLAPIARLLRERSGDLARLMAREMGKPFDQGVAEAKKCALVCDYYAEHAARQLADQSVASEMLRSYVSFRPLGVILAIMPWNFPLWQVIRVVIPALVVGNGVVVKHAPSTFGSSEALVRLLEDAGVPAGLVASLRVDVPQVAGLIADSRIAGVTLTGSTAAGRRVAELAGRHLKKCVLELGGSDAHVVLEDANLEQAAELCVTARMINNGQSCIGAKRLIAVEPVYDDFLRLVKQKMAAYQGSDPLKPGCVLGPLARRDLRDTLHEQVLASMAAGAKLEMGGRIPDTPGFWYPATVLSRVEPGMPAFEEELFGPVAVVIRARNEEHALELAARSPYGLGGAVYTRDTDRGERIAREELHAGSCFVNSLVRSDPRLPFGGVKDSGFGRELSAFGLLEFVNIKTVVVEASGGNHA